MERIASLKSVGENLSRFPKEKHFKEGEEDKKIQQKKLKQKHGN